MARLARFPVFLVPAVVCAVWTVYAGKDVNWDLLNYHYYIPFELLSGRLDQDFFAASAQSYLNPVGYLPFYLMVSSGWHSVLVSILLAAAHSLSLSLLYCVAWTLFAHLPRNDRVVFSILATALGAATSVFWMTVGSSYLDPLLVPPMLGGILLLLDGDTRAVRRAVLAGALFGTAAALKYSNAIFALAALPLTLAMPGCSRGLRLRAFLGYVAGGAAAVAVLAVPWLAVLAHEFGNPVFPLMNGWFRSPDALPFNIAGERFTPKDAVAVLSFPFKMIALGRSLYSENFAPDIRFAALLAAAVALPALAAMRRAPPARALRGTDWRVLAYLALGSALWLASSGNGRYGMIVLLLAGVCLARLVERSLTPGAARIALCVLLAIQVGTLVTASPPRWYLVEPWSKRWLPYDVPEPALRRPALYLTVEPLPMAVLAPFVHPGSSFVNFRGQFSIPTDSPRLTLLLERYRGQVRTLGRALKLDDGRPREDVLDTYNETLLRIGYRVDPTDCFTISWQDDSGDALSRAANWLAGTQPSQVSLSAASCGLHPAKRDPAEVEVDRFVSALFDRMEEACPALFRGQMAVTEALGSRWSRHYSGIDARLEADADRVVMNYYRTGVYVHLGALLDWAGTDIPSLEICR